MDEKNYAAEIHLPVPLSASQKGTFAYKTVKERMPIILTKVIDYLCRNREPIASKHGEAAREDLKQIIGSLSQLRSEMQTNKPILGLDSQEPDAEVWNRLLADARQSAEGSVTWFDSPWLLVECFMYRKIREPFEKSKSMQSFDPWFEQKDSALQAAMGTIELITKHLGKVNGQLQPEERQTLFREFLELSLWANRHDLSISAGELARKHHADPVGKLLELRQNLIVDETDLVWETISKSTGGTVAIILDNCGLELASDLILGDFLIRTHLADTVHFYVKSIPWFVSDVTVPDFHHTLDVIEGFQDLKPFAARWREYLNVKWVIRENPFFTLPCDYSLLKSVDSELYSSLEKCKLVIFKGDLNYRKLVGDLKWDFSEKFSRALRGFCPSPLVALRTLKAEVVVGLAQGMAEKCAAESEEWLVTGDYGVIQYSEQC